MQISFIVPVYNVENYIEECINSIIAQSIENFEIIVINDGSLDLSISIVEKIEDNRIKIIHQKNKGLSGARNTGLKNAKGKYVAFIDSDDFINNKYAYEKMINIAEKNGLDMVQGDAVKFFEDGTVKKLNNFKGTISSGIEKQSIKDFLVKGLENRYIYAPVWLNIYKREFLIKNDLYFVDGIYHEDEEFTPKVLVKLDEIGVYRESFYSYRQRENSIMSSLNYQKGEDMLYIAQKIYNEIIRYVEDDTIRKVLSIRVSLLIYESIFLYKNKNIENDIKLILKKLAVNKAIKIRWILIQINISMYIFCEYMYRYIKDCKEG